MATNLVSLVMQFLTPDMIAKIASALGLNETVVKKAIGGAVPSLLSGLAEVASAPGGVRQLSNVLAQQQPAALDGFKSLIAGSGQQAFAQSGSSMLSGLLGGGVADTLAQTVGKFAGLDAGASKSLLGMLGPVVVGVLGQQQRTSGLDASGIASLLTSQKDQFAAAIPSGLADQLSAAGLVDRLGGGLRAGTAAASAAAGRIGTAADRTVAEAGRAAQAAAAPARGSASSQWAYLAIGLIALGALAWYVLGGTGRDKVAEAPRPPATQPAGQATTAPVRPPADTVGLAVPSLTVGGVDLAHQVNASIGALRTTLTGITDTASAQAALPKIREATTQLDEVGTLSAKLPAEGKSALAKLIAAVMPSINQACDKLLATPGVGDVAKPAIDELRSRLDALARA
jgi:hypothetical protein